MCTGLSYVWASGSRWIDDGGGLQVYRSLSLTVVHGVCRGEELSWLGGIPPFPNVARGRYDFPGHYTRM